MIVYETKDAGATIGDAFGSLFEVEVGWSIGLVYRGRMNEGLTSMRYLGRTPKGLHRWEQTSGTDDYVILEKYDGKTIKGVTFELWYVDFGLAGLPRYLVAAHVGYARRIGLRRFGWVGQLPHDALQEERSAEGVTFAGE